jgi:hypothetical protein
MHDEYVSYNCDTRLCTSILKHHRQRPRARSVHIIFKYHECTFFERACCMRSEGFTSE